MSKVIKKVVDISLSPFKGPKQPKAPDFAAQERREAAEREEAARAAAEEARTRAEGGRASTILTGSRRLLDDETESRRLLSGK